MRLRLARRPWENRECAGRCRPLLAAGSGGRLQRAAAVRVAARPRPRWPHGTLPGGPCHKPPRGEHDGDLPWIGKGVWLGCLPSAGTTCPGSPVPPDREGLILGDTHPAAGLDWQSPLRSRCFPKDRAVRGQRRALAPCPHRGRLATSRSSPEPAHRPLPAKDPSSHPAAPVGLCSEEQGQGQAGEQGPEAPA